MATLITGLNGTLAPHFARHLESRGLNVVGWDRGRTDPDDEAGCEEWLDTLAPETVLHLAMGSERWAAQLASWCARHDRRFVYMSTAMVFDAEPDGPHLPDHPTTAKDDYGSYKAKCERHVLDANPNSLIVRIGWQIDLKGGGNNMVRQLTEQHASQGLIAASRRWTPAASLMSDTAAVTWQLLEEGAAGIHHLDSNAVDAMSFVELTGRLAKALGQRWTIQPNQDYQHDQRLIDPRVAMPSLSDRLPAC